MTASRTSNRPRGVRAVHTSQMTDVELARAWAAHFGFFGAKGGWICDPQGEHVVQGWDLFAQILVDSGYIEVGRGVHWRVMRNGESIAVTNPRFSTWYRTREAAHDLARKSLTRRTREADDCPAQPEGA